MAIGVCEDCNGAVSTFASFCPHCGRPGIESNTINVTVRDIEMGFGSMIVFMVKSAIASIPALIFLLVIGSIFAGSIAAIFLGKY